MSWFKKIFGSQSSSQEPKVYYSCNISTKQNENDNNQKESEKKSENITCSKFEECHDAPNQLRIVVVIAGAVLVNNLILEVRKEN